jgi:hypothetical protein
MSRGSMKYVASIVFLIALIGCNKKEADPVFDWGYLPQMADEHWENRKVCAHKTYVLGFFRPSGTEKTLHIKGEPISGRSHAVFMGDSCLQASIATRVYTSPKLQEQNYYSLTVGVPTTDERCMVDEPFIACKDSSVAYTTIFQIDIRANQINDYFKGKIIVDVVKYNTSSKIIEFYLGNEVIEFQVPNL